MDCHAVPRCAVPHSNNHPTPAPVGKKWGENDHWTCPTCTLNNSFEVANCAACGGAGPSGAGSLPPPVVFFLTASQRVPSSATTSGGGSGGGGGGSGGGGVGGTDNEVKHEVKSEVATTTEVPSTLMVHIHACAAIRSMLPQPLEWAVRATTETAASTSGGAEVQRRVVARVGGGVLVPGERASLLTTRDLNSSQLQVSATLGPI